MIDGFDEGGQVYFIKSKDKERAMAKVIMADTAPEETLADQMTGDWKENFEKLKSYSDENMIQTIIDHLEKGPRGKAKFGLAEYQIIEVGNISEISGVKSLGSYNF
jgi:hypothetical protein